MWTYGHQEELDEAANYIGWPSKGQARWNDTLKEENLNIAISTVSEELVNF